ncbi:OmpA/MotB family protein [Psychrobacter sp. I-STPA10]|uniref:OmpA/MotB family protein n=1 Tax=Psychrobacter sp. I-STPA10 TaxID=2585769 RepID=UPI001E30C821|nr:OmpA family protein [Psychrobacter sp. I-STPA10]
MLFYNEESPQDYEEDATTWIALSDLMTGLMAIFLTISIAILVNQDKEQVAIIHDVQEVLKAKDVNATIDPKTGDINIPTDFAFEFGQDTLTEQGRDFLDNFIPIYADAIFKELDPNQQDLITRLIVEGHTDRVGSYAYNMDLSTRRANAVLIYIDNMQFDNKEKFLQKLTAVGRGENDTVGQDEVENPKDRKIVFKFNFRQTNFLAENANTGNDDIDKSARIIDKRAKQAQNEANGLDTP